jgi:hypothetical protein
MLVKYFSKKVLSLAPSFAKPEALPTKVFLVPVVLKKPAFTPAKMLFGSPLWRRT